MVADEIRALATRTADSTREIGTIVGALRAQADASLVSMGQSRTLVEEGVNLSGRAAAALGSIQEGAANSLQQVRAISRGISRRNRKLVESSMRYSRGLLDLISNATGSYQGSGLFMPFPAVRTTVSHRI